jgi:Ankyrin repeats (3 copies)/Ankyrin repeat
VNTLKVINDSALDMPNAEVLSLWARSFEIGSDRTNRSTSTPTMACQRRPLASMTMMTADSSDSSTSFESSLSSAVTPNIGSGGSSSSCRTHAVLGKIAYWILERERAQCSLDANVSYDAHSRYFRPVEVAASIERLIRRCEASIAAVKSVLTHPHHHRQHDKDGDGGGTLRRTIDRGRRSCDATTRAGPGLWLLLSATNLESECATALLHLAVALDSPLACAGLLVQAIEAESSENDDATNDENDDELQYVNEHPSLLYPWLIQEASINASVHTLKLLLENAPHVIHPSGGESTHDAPPPEGSRRIDAPPFRPCRMARSDAMQFLERLARTMLLLLDQATTTGVENPCWNDAYEDSSLALELHHSPSWHASLSSSYGPSAPHLTAVFEEWDEWVERIRSRSEHPDDVEPSCAQSLLRSSMLRSTWARQVSGDQGERSSSNVTQLLLSPPCGSSPLHWASYKGNVECAALLLEHGADPNAVAIPTGWTPLHDAAYSNSTEVMELLLAAGSNVNATAASGATPLCFACQEDAADAALLLLQHNATVTSPAAVHSAAATTMTHSGPAPLLASSGFTAVPPLPFSGSSVPSSQQQQQQQQQLPPLAGYTPLHYCARFNSAQAMRVLLSHCQTAVTSEDEDTRLQTLLDAPDFYGRRSLDIACIRASVDVLYELLHQGATVAIRSTQRPSGKARRSQVSDGYSASFPPPAAPRTVSDLRSMIPKDPVLAPKPWNCLTQESIGGCHALLDRIGGGWTAECHDLYTPDDRAAIDAIRTDVSDDLERTLGVYRDAWPVVLGYCGRGWFRPSAADDRK